MKVRVDFSIIHENYAPMTLKLMNGDMSVGYGYGIGLRDLYDNCKFHGSGFKDSQGHGYRYRSVADLDIITTNYGDGFSHGNGDGEGQGSVEKEDVDLYLLEELYE